MIYVVEDEPVLRRSMVELLRADGHQIEGFPDAEQALAAIKGAAPDALLFDLQLPGMGGLELSTAVGGLDASIVRIAMTAHSTAQAAIQAIRGGCYEYLEKPVDLLQLSRLVKRAISERRSSVELSWHRASAPSPTAAGDAILGESGAVQALRQQIATLARLGHPGPPVLVTGETGVGKGLLARAIHAARATGDAPWIEVNCAAIPLSLMEAELFGYERSAFTDAKQAKPGLFEAAHGGTIFLDEIGELALEVQAKLLKVLESQHVRRLGSVRERPFAAAVIAASNVDLRAAVAAGRFRADLFHRLAAFVVAIPPLRERGADAVHLARTFLLDAARRYHKRLAELSPAAERHIQAHAWPGNVRELRFAIDRAAILASDDAATLEAEHLVLAGLSVAPASHSPRARIGASGTSVEIALPEDGVPFKDLEKAILAAALAKTSGNVVRAARLLHMRRDAFRYRMRKLGLSGSRDGDPSAG